MSGQFSDFIYRTNNLLCVPYMAFSLPVVATDDEKIAECCRGFGADVIMTSESCQNGRFFSFVVVRFQGFG